MLHTFLPNNWPTLKLEKKSVLKNAAWQVLPIIIYSNTSNNVAQLTIAIDEKVNPTLPLVIIQEEALPAKIIINCSLKKPLTLWTLNYNQPKEFNIYLQRQSKITHIAWQQIQTNYKIFITQEAQCLSYLYPVQQGSLDYQVFLQESASVSKIFALGYAANDFVLKSTILVNHQAPNTISYILNKNLANQKASITIIDGITINKQATASVSTLEIKNMLLAKQSSIKAVPQLAIYTQDVECRHANSIGTFNEDWLFYLQSRGIPFDTAYFLLLQDFIDGVIYPDPKLKQYLLQELALPITT